MRRYLVVLCVLALGAPFGGRAQEAEDHTQASDYSDYFGEPVAADDEAEAEGPRSLSEARRTGRAYRLGQKGSSYRRPDRDIHVVQEGDTLWDLSAYYFGSPLKWPELWSYNPEVTNPHWIYPLDQIRLSGATLAQDEADAAAKIAEQQTVEAGTTQGGSAFVEPPQGLLTELAPRVTVSNKLLKPETVFLRDQGYLDDEAIKSSGQVVAAREEQMFLSNSDEAYVKFKPGQDVRVGVQYTVYRTIPQEERDPGESGTLVRILGTVVVRSYDRERGIARTLVTESMEPIERGLPVTLMERRFELVPPRRNEANVVARIIGSVHPRSLVSFGNVVFLDVGEGKGVQPGNRFFVVRRGDNWMDVLKRPPEEMGNAAAIPKYDRDALPKEVVAELRVIKVRKKNSVALVTRSDTDVFQGDTAEMREGF